MGHRPGNGTAPGWDEVFRLGGRAVQLVVRLAMWVATWSHGWRPPPGSRGWSATSAAGPVRFAGQATHADGSTEPNRRDGSRPVAVHLWHFSHTLARRRLWWSATGAPGGGAGAADPEPDGGSRTDGRTAADGPAPGSAGAGPCSGTGRAWGPAASRSLGGKGVAWRDVPIQVVGYLGVTAWRRLRRWTEAGVWPRLHEVLLAELREAGLLDMDDAAIDRSHVRALKGGLTSTLRRSIGAGRAASST